MPNGPQTGNPATVAPPQRPDHNAVIREQILRHLGRPDSLWDVQVRRLWGDCYRVNVLIGPDAASARVAQSFFLQTDDRGTIVTSDPEIGRRN